jgi:hypothetical protein
MSCKCALNLFFHDDHFLPVSVWFTRNLGDAMLAGEWLDQMKTFFLSEYGKADNAREMAVFIRHESEGCLHCEVILYFTPASASVAAAVDAIPCEMPSPDGLGLLAGSEESWSIFF